jgi:hypothetical protein
MVLAGGALAGAACTVASGSGTSNGDAATVDDGGSDGSADATATDASSDLDATIPVPCGNANSDLCVVILCDGSGYADPVAAFCGCEADQWSFNPANYGGLCEGGATPQEAGPPEGGATDAPSDAGAQD